MAKMPLKRSDEREMAKPILSRLAALLSDFNGKRINTITLALSAAPEATS